VIDDTVINCTVGDSSSFSTLSDIVSSLSGAVPVSVVVTDGQGRTALSFSGVSINVNSVLAFEGLIQHYPGWFAMIVIAVVLLIGGGIFGIIKAVGIETPSLKDLLGYAQWERK